MSYNVITFQSFDKQVRRLSKKHPSLKTDLLLLGLSLANDPKQGVALGMNCYKIRLAVTSKAKGKSGGARIVTHVHFTHDTIILMSIYDKSEQESISDKAIKELLKNIYL